MFLGGFQRDGETISEPDVLRRTANLVSVLASGGAGRPVPEALPNHVHSNHPARGKPGPLEHRFTGQEPCPLGDIFSRCSQTSEAVDIFCTWPHHNGLGLKPKTMRSIDMTNVADMGTQMVNAVHGGY